ncbi:L-threonylcarbamoyladenylate synthase [Aliidiomarina haloalkalitolerans]|uniref:Threonylcarbamoyl-AMP synthase n=1 Tax=Aliidiomarina haloalkalitolerans TaxID=859059 RepID=A0A432VXK0_9GAMM|nr:L-threonylcarbamoyladenylate synthase [Aliidiomarina haloalkalitolerans]MCL4409286.1 L-threonylcarbamoyladenylate synthase [Gammaproteobacteria bacterium]RUO21399.1 threonylcarbamoyl-AMP synthase [Aliidiomarina haloalkalitolerans]
MSQFFQVHPDNPQVRLLQQAADIVRAGGVIVYPTDSGYALGCQIQNKDAVERILRIRQLGSEHNFTLVCRDLSELSIYAKVGNQAFRLLKNNTPGPYTFVLRGTKEVPKRLLNPKRKTIGLRVPDNRIAQGLLAELNEPLMSTTMIFPGEEFAEPDPYEIRLRLEKLVDLIIDGGHLMEKPTTVVDMVDDEIEVIRVGEGDPSPFN